jgi:hypothetical protein
MRISVTVGGSLLAIRPEQLPHLLCCKNRIASTPFHSPYARQILALASRSHFFGVPVVIFSPLKESYW